MSDDTKRFRNPTKSLSEIARALVRRGVIAPDLAIEAEQRKKLYGGGLDTALLEIQACDEETLTSHLAELIGIPLADVAALTLPSRDPTIASLMDEATAIRLGAVPRAKPGDTLLVLVWPEHDHDALVAWSEQRTLLVEPALVLEVRFRVALHALYGTPLTPRHLALLARLVGATAARAMTQDRPASARPTPTPLVRNTDPTETFLAAARLGDAAARRSALRHLSRRLRDPRVVSFRNALEEKAKGAEPATACAALQALAELRDKAAVPTLAELLDHKDEDVQAAAQAALVALTCEDLGRKSKRWLDFWEKMGNLSRVEWLLEGLAHRTPELRLLAANQLYEISGEYFGYHYDLPERDREEARQRWIAWWKSQGARQKE